MTYSDDLKNGKWQKKRLQVFERDKFRCRCCLSEDNIQVHHLYYLPNTKPWEYDLDGLVTVCETHHQILTKELGKLSGLIAFKILCGNFDLLDKNEYKNLHL